MNDMEKVIKGLECCTYILGKRKCDECPYAKGPDCYNLILDAKAMLKAQEPLTAEVKWQKRRRKRYRQYTGFDAMGDEHTVTVCEESEGREPYCGKCSAQLAESFIIYCPRCGVKLIIPSQTDEKRRDETWT